MSAASGSLALARATLFVGTHAKTARVRGFDLGGRELPIGFSFRDPVLGRSAVAGVCVDEDHTLWIADHPAGRVRRFSVFGREVGGLSIPCAKESVLPGSIRRPVDVEVQDGNLIVAEGGESPHAVQVFTAEGAYRGRVHALGEPGRAFLGVTRVAACGARLHVVESLARRVQVFRSGEFHFAFQLSDALGRRLEPCAVAPLVDGRSVVACRDPESALVLVDASGRALRVLARPGEAEGEVLEPSDLVLEAGEEDHRARLYAIDRDGIRVQVFTLEGRCLGVLLSEPVQRIDPQRIDPGQDRRRGKKGGR